MKIKSTIILLLASLLTSFAVPPSYYGSFHGDGSGITNVTAALANGLTNNAWSVSMPSILSIEMTNSLTNYVELSVSASNSTVKVGAYGLTAGQPTGDIIGPQGQLFGFQANGGILVQDTNGNFVLGTKIGSDSFLKIGNATNSYLLWTNSLNAFPTIYGPGLVVTGSVTINGGMTINGTSTFSNVTFESVTGPISNAFWYGTSLSNVVEVVPGTGLSLNTNVTPYVLSATGGSGGPPWIPVRFGVPGNTANITTNVGGEAIGPGTASTHQYNVMIPINGSGALTLSNMDINVILSSGSPIGAGTNIIAVLATNAPDGNTFASTGWSCSLAGNGTTYHGNSGTTSFSIPMSQATNLLCDWQIWVYSNNTNTASVYAYGSFLQQTQ